MQALIWATVVVACYLTAWGWGVMFVDALRRRHLAAIPLLALAGVATLVLAGGNHGDFPLRPLAYLPAAAGPALVYYLLVPRSLDDWKWKKRRKEDARQIALHLVLITGGVFFAMPYVWMVLTSLKPDNAIFKDPSGLPHPFRWSNYPRTFQFLEYVLGRVNTGYGSLFVLNTLQVTTLSLACTLLSSSLVAYAFARLRWPGRDILFMVLLATMMLPGAVTMVPRFLIFKQLGWIDTLLPLWVPSLFAGAFEVFLLRQFMLTIPRDLEEAAVIDGCGYFTIFWRVIMPLLKPAMAAISIMGFIGSWNDFMGPLIYISSPGNMTGSYALQLFQSANGGEWALLLAASTLWTLPVVLLFFVAQRAFIEGITLTGMKN